jgi:cell division septal protein FtsQ
MAKKNRKSTTSGRHTVFFAYTLVFVFILFVLFFVGRQVNDFLYSSPVFLVKEVVTPADLQYIDAQTLQRLVGKNILRVDLVSLQHQLQARYPEIDQLKIFRRFPSQIVLTAKRRQAFVCLSTGKQDLLLDKEGYVLSVNAMAGTRLPIIRGVPLLRGVVLGKPLRDPELIVALKIVSVFEESDILRKYELSFVDVENPSKILLLFSNNLNVLLDKDKIDNVSSQLVLLLAQENLNLNTIDYIDLRFKEPVIRWKTK